MYKLREFIEGRQRGINFSLVVGDNGAGKSRLLRDLAEYYCERGRPVISVCNTPYDRLAGVRGLVRISASQGRRLPTNVLKRAIVVALEEGPTRLRSISNTLEYCGYKSKFGLLVRGFSYKRIRDVEERARELGVSQAGIDEIMSAISIVAKLYDDGLQGEPYWMDFSKLDLEALIEESVARLVKWERVLFKIGVIKQLDILLMRRNGVPIPVHEASSGELTLISTLVFLAVCIKEGALILIDEPENSLHPQWQKEYVRRLADLLYHYQPSIVIATHAPIVVSGAQKTEGLNVEIFQAVDGETRRLPSSSGSVEGTLWQIFHTVTPVNHYISEQLANALSELERGKMSQMQLFDLIDLMEEQAYDSAQQPFFNAARKLAIQVMEDVRRD